MPEAVATAGRGLAHSGRPGDMGELWQVWRKRGFRAGFSEFLDEFYLHPSAGALDTAPPNGIDPEYRAFLAATCETLALDHQIPVPEWTQRVNATLDTPICWELFRGTAPCHPNDRETLTEIIAQSTPEVFRRHGILVRANVLSRT